MESNILSLGIRLLTVSLCVLMLAAQTVLYYESPFLLFILSMAYVYLFVEALGGRQRWPQWSWLVGKDKYQWSQWACLCCVLLVTAFRVDRYIAWQEFSAELERLKPSQTLAGVELMFYPFIDAVLVRVGNWLGRFVQRILPITKATDA